MRTNTLLSVCFYTFNQSVRKTHLSPELSIAIAIPDELVIALVAVRTKLKSILGRQGWKTIGNGRHTKMF